MGTCIRGLMHPRLKANNSNRRILTIQSHYKMHSNYVQYYTRVYIKKQLASLEKNLVHRTEEYEEADR